MNSSVVRVSVKGVYAHLKWAAPSFSAQTGRLFIIYVDASIGNAISMIINGVQRERPMTHDLIGNIFSGHGHRAPADRDQRCAGAHIFLPEGHSAYGKRAWVKKSWRSTPARVMPLPSPFGRRSRFSYIARSWDSEEDMSELLERILKEQE